MNKDMKKIGIAALYEDHELKSLFLKYLVWIGIVEFLILGVAWVYQLGINVPFPWKAYFMVAFLAPVAITFLLGVFVTAFNRYVYDHSRPGELPSDFHSSKFSKMVRLMNFLMQLPFLIILLVLGALIGAIYNMSSLISFMGRLGEATLRLIMVGLIGAMVLGTICGIVYMIIQYKLRKQEKEFEYKRQVMERLGVAIVEDKLFVNRHGRLESGGDTAALDSGNSGDIKEIPEKTE